MVKHLKRGLISCPAKDKEFVSQLYNAASYTKHSMIPISQVHISTYLKCDYRRATRTRSNASSTDLDLERYVSQELIQNKKEGHVQKMQFGAQVRLSTS